MFQKRQWFLKDGLWLLLATFWICNCHRVCCNQNTRQQIINYFCERAFEGVKIQKGVWTFFEYSNTTLLPTFAQSLNIKSFAKCECHSWMKWHLFIPACSQKCKWFYFTQDSIPKQFFLRMRFSMNFCMNAMILDAIFIPRIPFNAVCKDRWSVSPLIGVFSGREFRLKVRVPKSKSYFLRMKGSAWVKCHVNCNVICTRF